jgi:hypothetical protein
MPGSVGDDTETGHLGCGPCGGVDGQIGRHGFGGFIHTLEVMNLATVGDYQPNSFTAVVGGTAPQSDQAVAAVFLIDINPGVDIFIGGIGNCLIIDNILHLRLCHEIGDLLGDAGGGNAFIGDDKRF